jgi:hypothetical protein
MSPIQISNWGHFSIGVTIRLEQGPPLTAVRAAVEGERVTSTTKTFTDVRPVGEGMLCFSCDDGYIGSAINIQVASTEREGGRSWSNHRTIVIPEPPSEPMRH